MIDPSKVGTDWQADELDAIVATYFAMLEGLPTAQRGFKAESKRALDARIGRGIGSIDFKLGNLAYVAGELGLTRLPGFAPAPNAQKGGIYSALERYLDAHPDAWNLGLPLSSPFHGEGDHEVVEGATPRWPTAHEPDQAFASPWGDQDTPPSAILPITAPPPLGPARPPRPEGLARIVRKYDPAARDHRNRALGQLGEHHVFHHERAFLIAHDRPDLARKIRWTSQEDGDGAGYDIKSFDPAGRERLIEVKATRGGPATDFFLTRTEREVSAERPDAWRLYRLHDLAAAPALFQLKPPLEAAVTLTAETWRAGF
ncbi:hypothetical protein D3C73_74320 [compost metagenome]